MGTGLFSNMIFVTTNDIPK